MSVISKTIAYFRRNGIMNTVYAVTERLSLMRNASYSYAEISDQEVLIQKKESKSSNLLFSILVPVYETREEHLREMIESCLDQTYENFELLLADASVTSGPKNVIESFTDSRIKYLRIENNKGISENTNVAIDYAKGDYLVLCDHDDLLTKSALYELYRAISQKENLPYMVYTDEDKCNNGGDTFFEPNIKADFNLDMLLSNNYICHITTVRSDVFKELKLRTEYDGAQDHDLVLRIAGKILEEGQRPEDYICHVAKVLYHWRCHEASTAANPESKNYAYEAGKRAISDFVTCHFGQAEIEHLKHRGFYRVSYGKDIFELRKDIGAIGGYVTRGAKVIGGAYDREGSSSCEIGNIHYSGTNHVGAVTRDVYALDLRNMTPREELFSLYDELLNKWQEEIVSLAKEKNTGSYTIDYGLKEEILKKYNLQFAKKAHEMGYRLLLDPQYEPFERKADREENILPISIVIPNVNGMDYLKSCLDSIFESNYKPLEVIVVDNASEDDSVRMLSEEYPEVLLLKHEINTGFTGAVNHGIRYAKGKYVFLLNNDTTIDANCLEKLYLAMEKEEKIFSAGALMIKMDDTDIVDDAGDRINFLGYPKSPANGKEVSKYKKDRTAPVFSACGGACLYRKSIFDKIGAFDEMHFAYFEDVDIGFRARIYGYLNVSVRDAVVYHKGSATSGSKHNKFKVSLSSKNSVILFAKNLPLLMYLINFPFLLTGYMIKFAFFCLKGMGKEYAQGIFTGMKEALSYEGRANHVKFRLKNLCNYFCIQMWFFN